MRYLIDIGHPAHVHYFSNFARSVLDRGNELLFTCRDKDVTLSLLRHKGFNHINLGRPFKSIPGKLFGLVYFTIRILFVSLKYRPDMFLNATIYSAFVARITGKPHISIEDTFNMEQVKLYLPFTSCVLTGSYNHPDLGRKEVRYNGYHELLYLHPNYFSPDSNILKELGVDYDQPYVIMRFVSWNASHDVGHQGISLANKIKAVEEFSRVARVFISSEKELPEEMERYRINIEPYRIHDAMAFCSLVFGESATMVSEAAMLGIPGVFLDNTGRYYTRDLQERYNLVFNYDESESGQKQAIEKGIEILSTPGMKDLWKERREKMLEDQIDNSAFLTWFVEHWPQSLNLTREDNNYQLRFRNNRSTFFHG